MVPDKTMHPSAHMSIAGIAFLQCKRHKHTFADCVYQPKCVAITTQWKATGNVCKGLRNVPCMKHIQEIASSKSMIYSVWAALYAEQCGLTASWSNSVGLSHTVYSAGLSPEAERERASTCCVRFWFPVLIMKGEKTDEWTAAAILSIQSA